MRREGGRVKRESEEGKVQRRVKRKSAEESGEKKCRGRVRRRVVGKVRSKSIEGQ